VAANDFWRRLAKDLTQAELEAGLYVNPLLLQAALLDITGGQGITLATARAQFGLPAGTDAGTEFGDLAATAANLPGTAGTTAKRGLQERVIVRIMSAAILAGRRTKINPNPYATGNALRLRAREILVQEGATPLVGAMSPAL
jgi:hypothetical protein